MSELLISICALGVACLALGLTLGLILGAWNKPND